VPATTGWPSSTWEGINSIRIQFVAGYAPGTDSPIDLAANVPPVIKAAILLRLGQMYEAREELVIGTIVNRLPSGGVDNLLRSYRVALGMA
jgi:hypothetical protein